MTAADSLATPGKDSRILGTLVVVVIRAKNLTNRVRIGKQNPYATVTYGLNKKRTETIDRGGQQPTWDAEFRFEIAKDVADQVGGGAVGNAVVNKHGGVLPMTEATRLQAAAASASTTGSTGGKKVLKLACYADDVKDPKLVGEGMLELEETIKKGAFDGELDQGSVRERLGADARLMVRLGQARAEGSLRWRDLSRANLVL
jgi:hypothetical protein